MKMEEVKRIYKLLLDSTGLKIKDIAKALDLDKYYVADVMFSTDNISYWYQDSSFLWFAKEGALQIEEEPKEDNLFPLLEAQNVILGKRFLVENASSALRLYFKYVERCYLLTREEEFELFKRSREGDEKAFKILVTTHLRFVIPIAKLYAKYGIPLEDLIQEGNIGLMNAIKRFDYVHYRGFVTYATSWIFQAISTYVQNQRYLIRIPINQLDLYRKVQKIKEKFEQKNGYRPSVSDIEIDNIPVERLALICKLPDNLNQLVCFSEDLDSFESNLPPTDYYLEKESKTLEVCCLLGHLGERDNQLVKAYFGLEHGRVGETYENIGERFGLTRERVRQIVYKAVKILREKVALKGKEADIGDTIKLNFTDQVGRVHDKKKTKDGYTLLVVKMKSGKTEKVSSKAPIYEILSRTIKHKPQNRIPTADASAKKKKPSIPTKATPVPSIQHESDKPHEVSTVGNVKVGDRIIYDKKHCTICNIFDRGSSSRFLVKYDNGVLDLVPNNKSRYKIASSAKKSTHNETIQIEKENKQSRKEATIQPKFLLSTPLNDLVKHNIITNRQLRQLHKKHLRTIGDVKKMIEKHNLTPHSTRFTQYTLDMWFGIINLLNNK